MIKLIPIDNGSKLPIYIQIYRAIRENIVIGEYVKGQKLPSIRSMAIEMNISKNTVTRAYAQLASEGYIINIPKSGYVVAEMSNQLIEKANRFLHKSLEMECNTTLKCCDESENIKYDFTYHKMDMSLFSERKWRKYFDDALLGNDVAKLGMYGDIKGEYELRREIKKYLNFSRNIKCNERQIVLCSGIQDSIERLCRLFHVSEVALECPNLPIWKEIFRDHGFSVNTIELFPENHYVEDVIKSNARIAIITPSHQFPLGMVMPLGDRLRLLDWAEKNDGYIIEDDYDCEYRYSSQPLSAMYSLDQGNRVIYMGTFSKILMPGMRMNYLVLPDKMVERFETVYRGNPPSVAWIMQKAIYQFMQNEDFINYIYKARRLMKKKYETLVNTCNKVFGNAVELLGSDAGVHVLFRVNHAKNSDDLIKLALERGVRVYPIKEYWMQSNNCPDNVVLVGFAYIDICLIEKGIQLLGIAWNKFL